MLRILFRNHGQNWFQVFLAFVVLLLVKQYHTSPNIVDVVYLLFTLEEACGMTSKKHKREGRALRSFVRKLREVRLFSCLPDRLTPSSMDFTLRLTTRNDIKQPATKRQRYTLLVNISYK